MLNTILNASGHKSWTSIINLILFFSAYLLATFATARDGTAAYIISGFSMVSKYFLTFFANIWCE